MTAPTVTMRAPTAEYTQILGAGGTTYYSDANGLVANVLASDVISLMEGGYTQVAPGYAGLTLRLLDGRNSDGSVLAAAAASGKMGVSVTLGTSMGLVSEAASNSTITDTVLFDVVLPVTYPSGTPAKVKVNTNHVIGSGVLSTHTVTAHLYKTGTDGTQGADLITSSAGTTTATATDIEFDTTATSLAAGDRLVLTLVTKLVETSTHNVTSLINSVRFIP